jgi:hypothetical protein
MLKVHRNTIVVANKPIEDKLSSFGNIYDNNIDRDLEENKIKGKCRQ